MVSDMADLYENKAATDAFGDDWKLQQAMTAYIDAAEQLANNAKRVHVGRLSTDDFWMNEAMDNFDTKSRELRAALQ